MLCHTLTAYTQSSFLPQDKVFKFVRKMQHEIDDPPEVEDLEPINNQIVPCHFQQPVRRSLTVI